MISQIKNLKHNLKPFGGWVKEKMHYNLPEHKMPLENQIQDQRNHQITGEARRKSERLQAEAIRSKEVNNLKLPKTSHHVIMQPTGGNSRTASRV